MLCLGKVFPHILWKGKIMAITTFNEFFFYTLDEINNILAGNRMSVEQYEFLMSMSEEFYNQSYLNNAQNIYLHKDERAWRAIGCGVIAYTALRQRLLEMREAQKVCEQMEALRTSVQTDDAYTAVNAMCFTAKMWKEAKFAELKTQIKQATVDIATWQQVVARG